MGQNSSSLDEKINESSGKGGKAVSLKEERLKEVPRELERLKESLTSLNLSKNELKSVPPEFGDFHVSGHYTSFSILFTLFSYEFWLLFAFCLFVPKFSTGPSHPLSDSLCYVISNLSDFTLMPHGLKHFSIWTSVSPSR